jgi:dihydrofolate reductase
MGKIVMSGPQNVSLDGVVQDPDGKEGFGLGGWFVQFGGEDLEEWNKLALDEALRADAWLLGRRSYEFFGMRWRPRSGELADRLNGMPKYVVSSTLEDPDWNNSTVLKGDVVTEVSKLKQALDGEIVVPASYQLGRTLIAHDLVDELRMVVFPVVLGAGERLFGETSDDKPMRLVSTASPSSHTSSSGGSSGRRTAPAFHVVMLARSWEAVRPTSSWGTWSDGLSLSPRRSRLGLMRGVDGACARR